MRLKDIRGREVKLDIKSSDYPMQDEENCKSKVQYRCGQVLRKIYPRLTILEEFVIPGSMLRIDFFVPQMNFAIEVQGEQHGKFNPFFHKDRGAFSKSLDRDSTKAVWCRNNNIELICVESENDVGRSIAEYFSGK